MRAQKLDNQEFLINAEVDDAEETLVRSLHELSRRFDVEEGWRTTRRGRGRATPPPPPEPVRRPVCAGY